jgi:hypothetical protein
VKLNEPAAEGLGLALKMGGIDRKRKKSTAIALCKRKPIFSSHDRPQDRPSSFESSIDTDQLRPALLLGATQVVIALLSSVLLTSGALS